MNWKQTFVHLRHRMSAATSLLRVGYLAIEAHAIVAAFGDVDVTISVASSSATIGQSTRRVQGPIDRHVRSSIESISADVLGK